MNKDISIKEAVNETIENTDVTNIIEEIEKENAENAENTNNIENTENNVPKLEIINNDIAALLTKNPDTIGWLKVKNTNIDYPIVQGFDNKYYLKHNFNFEKDNNGWVFLNYKNNYKELDDNTIFYAHNRYYSGVMFGTLQNTLKSNWYKNEENLTISFRTLYENYEFKVFSVYKIKTTTDYLNIKFANDQVKLEFLNMLKNRSIYDFNYTPNPDDKIITLSTCADEYSRIVLHAYLQKK